MSRITDHFSAVPAIRLMQLEVGPGKCCFCEDPLVPFKNGMFPIHCREQSCISSYHRLYNTIRPSRQPKPKNYTCQFCGSATANKVCCWSPQCAQTYNNRKSRDYAKKKRAEKRFRFVRSAA